MPARDHLRPVVLAAGSQDEDELAFEQLPEIMWSLPEGLPTEIRELGASLMEGMRRDIRHMPVGTLAAMQLERVVSYYLDLRLAEMAATTVVGPRMLAGLHKQFTEASRDLNNAVYSNKISPEDLHQMVAAHTAKVVAAVLRSLPNDQAKPLYAQFARALQASGETA